RVSKPPRKSLREKQQNRASVRPPSGQKPNRAEDRRPRVAKSQSAAAASRGLENGQGWIRTSEGVKPADLQSAPFGHFGTYPRAFDITHALPLASSADRDYSKNSVTHFTTYCCASREISG